MMRLFFIWSALKFSCIVFEVPGTRRVSGTLIFADPH